MCMSLFWKPIYQSRNDRTPFSRPLCLYLVCKNVLQTHWDKDRSCFVNRYNFYRPQGEGNVFTGVCLSIISLMATRSLLGLVLGAVGMQPTGMLSCCEIFYLWLHEYITFDFFCCKILQPVHFYTPISADSFPFSFD